MKILIVDDDEIIRMGLKKIIEKCSDDFCVAGEVSDGAYALEEMKSRDDVDLIITDVRMPVMDGIELISEVRKFNEKVKIIVLSGFDDFNYVRNAFRDGAVDYLLKPIKRDEFLELLHRTDREIREERLEHANRIRGTKLLVADVLEKLLLHGEAAAAEDFERLNLDFMRPYFIFIVQMDKYYKEKTSKEDHRQKIGEIKQTVVSSLDIKIKSEDRLVFYEHDDQVAVIVFPEQEVLFLEIREMYVRMNAILGDQTTLSLGAGRLHQGRDEVHQAYQEAAEAVEARFYMGKNHCIQYSQIQQKSIDFEYDLGSAADDLAREIELFSYVNARNIVQKVFLDLSFLKPVKFRKYMLDLLEMLSIRIKDFEKALLFAEVDYSYYIADINTYNELRTFMLSLIKGSIQYLEAEKKKRSARRIELAKQYIQMNYMKPLSLNEAADHIELNPSYFSNLFKLETGETFSDYVLKIRMQKAMELLKDPKIKIYEIGILVGYEDAVSFGRAFKKRVGMSPKEYRKTVY